MEERTLLSAITWDGGAGDGLWSSRDNWSGNLVPGAADDVTINPLGGATIVVRGFQPQIKSLINYETLSVEGRVDTGASRIAVSQSLTNHGIIRMETTSADGLDRSTHLTATSGTLMNAADGRIEVKTGQGWNRYITGNFRNEGTVSVESGATLTLNGSGQVEQASGLIETFGTGQVLQTSGRFTFTGGATSGAIRLTGTEVLIAATVTSTSTVRVVGDNSVFLGNNAPTVTVWLEGNTANGYSQLFVDQDVVNHGILRMETSSADGLDRSTYLTTRNSAKLINASDGRIESYAGAGWNRRLNGVFVNQGRIDAFTTTYITTGTLEADGGTYSDKFYVAGANISVKSAAAPNLIRIVGDGSHLISDNLPNMTLFLDGNPTTGFARLYVNQGVVNHGIIRMETTTADGGDRSTFLTATSGTLVNAPDGRIEAKAGQGWNRYISGDFRNEGTVSVESGATLTLNGSGQVQQASGLIETFGTGQVLQTSGRFTFTGGATSGAVRLTGTEVLIADTVTSTSTVRVVGDNSVFLGNNSPTVTVWLEGNTANGYSRLFVDQNVVNHGILRMETSSTDGGDRSTHLTTRNNAKLINASDGRIEAKAGQGWNRYISGNFRNEGTVSVESGATLTLNGSGQVEQASGLIETFGTGQVLQTSGRFTFTGGATSGGHSSNGNRGLHCCYGDQHIDGACGG